MRKNKFLKRAAALCLCVTLAVPALPVNVRQVSAAPERGNVEELSAYPYLDTNLSFEERATDLVSRMTLEEKISQLRNGSSWLIGADSPAIPRLGVDAYRWWSEAVHGINKDGTATSFTNGLGMAATWDPARVQEVASAISDEGREKFNTVPRNGDHGLSYWSPTINLSRDPRWGRSDETYGEDPYLTSQIADGFVKGLQGYGEDDKYIKSFACAKHFMANNSESNRHRGTSDFDERTLREYYGYPFQKAVEDSNVESVMSSYNRVNGIPSTTNLHMLDDLLRRTWGFDGFVVTDCDTLSDILHSHPWRPLGNENEKLNWGNEWNTLPSGWDNWLENPGWGAAEASALSLLSGTDANCGTTMSDGAKEAIEKGYMTEDQIDIALVRLFTSRMESGEFDPKSEVSYYGEEFQPGKQIHSEEHQKLAEDVATEAVVMLKNENGSDGTPLLPLNGKEIQNLVVVGDYADEIELGGYSTTEPQHTSTPLEGIEAAWRRASGNENAEVTFIAGQSETSSGNFLMNIRDPQMYDDNGNLLRTVDWDANSGIQGCTVEGAGNIGWSYKGTNWVKFDEVDFTDITKITVDMAGADPNMSTNNTVPTKVEIRIGSPDGDLLTLVEAKAESGDNWDHYRTYEFSKLGGGYNVKHKDVYFVFKEGGSGARFTEEEKLKIQNADAVVAYAGARLYENGYSEEQDASNLDLPNNQAKMINDVLELNPDTIVYTQSASQINVEPFRDKAHALLWTCYNGQAQGNAAGKLLFGESNPSGKLPITWYTDVNELDHVQSYSIRPNSYNSPEGSLGRTYQYFNGGISYPFGHGLSYSEFTFSNLQISKKEVTPDDTITVTFDVTNTSGPDGAAVGEVYVVSPNADKIDRPAKRLKGFDKKMIAAGGTEKYSIDIPAEDLFYWDEENEIQTYDQGEYTIEVGSSSDDENALKATFELSGQLTPELKTVTAIPTGHILDVRTPEKTIKTKLSASRNDQTFVENPAVTYTSSNVNVAAVNDDGEVTAVAPGVVTITAGVTENGVTKTDSYPVVVKGVVSVSGTVTAVGEAVEGAVVALGDQTATTDAEGHYVFEEVETNAYTVTASKDGYDAVSKDIVVDNDGVSELNFMLSPLTKADYENNYDNGANTWENLTGNPSNAAVSAANGEIKIVFPGGHTNVYDTKAPVFKNGVVEMDVRAERSGTRIGILLRANDMNHRAWAGCGDAEDQYFSEYWGDGGNSWSAMSNGPTFAAGETMHLKAEIIDKTVTLWVNGQKLFSNTMGNIPMEAGYVGLNTRNGNTVYVDNVKVISYDEPAGEHEDVAGRVVNELNAPIEGAAVELCDSEGNVLKTTATDALGNYKFKNAAIGEYKVRVTYDGEVIEKAVTVESVPDYIVVEKAVYAAKYTITVNGEVYMVCPYNTPVTVEAPAVPAGKEFVGWKADDKYVSFDETYKFYAANDISLTAVFEETVPEILPEALLSNAYAMDRGDSKCNIRFVGQIVLPEDYEIVQAGLVWSPKDTAALEIGKGAKETCIRTISDTNQFSVTIKGVPDGKFVCGKIFAKVRDNEGNETYIYSDPAKKVISAAK